MDTSKQRIKMCERAVEIQESKPKGWEQGNWWVSGGQPYCVGSYGEEYGTGIWLPTQDQLQEMIGDYETARDLIFGYASNLDNEPYLIKEGADYWEGMFTSMEQLWLAFVMKENNKVWDGDDWVKAD